MYSGSSGGRLIRGDNTTGNFSSASITPNRPSRRNRRFSLQPSTSRALSRTPSPKPSPNSSKQVTKSRFKVLILGAGKVGKTSIIQRFLYDKFTTKYRRTVEELHCAEFTIDRAKLTLDILDTAGSYEFPAMRELNIAASDAFILIFSYKEKGSFDEILLLREQIATSKGPNVPIVIVSNKSDEIENDFEYTATEKEKAEDMARQWNNGFVECSAKSGENVTKVFKELLIQAKVQYRLSPALKKRRQSLPGGVSAQPAHNDNVIPTASQLLSLRGKTKRNSCVVS